MFLDVVAAPGPATDTTALLVQLLYPVFLTTITAVVGFVGAAVRGWVKANTTSAQVTAFQKIAVVAVRAAEQISADFSGEQKFEYAKNYMETELAKRGIKVDADQIQAHIEAAVLNEFNYTEPVVSEPQEVVTDTVGSDVADLYPGLDGSVDGA